LKRLENLKEEKKFEKNVFRIQNLSKNLSIRRRDAETNNISKIENILDNA
jgi:hypothetical protein